jgi:hypothetical protein
MFNIRNHPWLPWLLFFVALVAAVTAGAAWWNDRKDQGLKRWSKVVSPEPDETFKSLTHLAPVNQPIRLEAADWAQRHVSVYSSPAIKEPPATLRDLADSGQAHAIDFLARNTKGEPHTWADLQEALTNANAAAAAGRDPFKFERVLVSTVTKGADWEPGDRMIWTRVFVQPINFEFGDYSVAATQNATDKIASIEATRSRKISADLALTIPGAEGAKANFAPSDERTTKTTSDINSQYEKLGVDIWREFLRIIRESNPGGDVLGNTLVPVTIVTDPATIQKTFPEDTTKEATSDDLVLLVTGTHLTDGTTDLEEKDATISVLPQAVLPHCPLIARVWMLYEQRHIARFGEFYEEGKQEIELLRKADGQRDIEIVPADDVAPAVWHIQILPPPPNKSLTDTTPVSGATVDVQADTMLKGRAGPDAPYRDMVFTDYGQASAFAHWARYKYNSKIGSLSLNYPPGPRASLVPFKTTGIACGPQDKARRTEATYQAKK